MPQPYTVKNLERAACTMVLPRQHMEKLKLISLRTGIPRNTIAALALDEYLARHYPERPTNEEETNVHGA